MCLRNLVMFSFMADLDERKLIYRLSIGMIICGVITFVVLLKKNFGLYGRYANGTGVLIPARWAWLIQESPALLVPMAIVGFGGCIFIRRRENAVVLAMYLVHYVQRTLIYPFLIRGGKPSPLYIIAMAILFCCINGYMQGRYHCSYAQYTHGYWTSALSIAGIAMYVAGLIINIHSDHVLRSLRKPGDTGYFIPYGGMFKYVSGANFFGEITEWFGYALFAGTLPAFAFAVFTAANTIPRALRHHEFYKEKFPAYPKDRKAVLPFVL